MTFSALAARTIPHRDKFSSRKGKTVTRVIVHHWAGTSGGDTRLADPGQKVSANYVLFADGSLAGQVPEEYRAWTSGSAAADGDAITIEVQNSSGAPQWLVSDAAVAKLTELIADVARRYGWGRVDQSRVRGHRDFAATACPGPHLHPRLGGIAVAANQLLHGAPTPQVATTPDPAPTVSKADQNVLAYQRRQNRYGAAGLFEDGVDGLITQAWRAWVAILQRELRAWKGVGNLVEDGDYGQITHTAVATVQRRNGLYADGIAQAKTISFMREHGSPVPDRPATR